MPYRTEWHEHGVEWEFHGAVTAREIERANDDFYRDERSDRSRYQIIDARRVTSVTWEERDIKVTAAYDLGAARTLKDVKVAYVASDDAIRGMLEQYADISRGLNSTWQFQGFADIDSARAWAQQ